MPLTLRWRAAPLVPGKPSQILKIGVIGGLAIAVHSTADYVARISQIFVVPLTLRWRPAPLVPGKPNQILKIGVIGGLTIPVAFNRRLHSADFTDFRCTPNPVIAPRASCARQTKPNP